MVLYFPPYSLLYCRSTAKIMCFRPYVTPDIPSAYLGHILHKWNGRKDVGINFSRLQLTLAWPQLNIRLGILKYLQQLGKNSTRSWVSPHAGLRYSPNEFHLPHYIWKWSFWHGLPWAILCKVRGSNFWRCKSLKFVRNVWECDFRPLAPSHRPLWLKCCEMQM